MVGQRISQSIETGFVYAIRNTLNGKRYIGSTANPDQRRRHHFARLRAGKHHSVILQKAFIKYGQAAFVFEIMETCDASSVRDREQDHLTSQRPEYNVSLIASQQTRLGLKSSPEHCARMSASLTGRISPMKGKRFTSEHRLKLSRAHQGKPKRKGWHHSESTKQKIRENRSPGIHWERTEETEKIRLAAVRRAIAARTPEQRAAFSRECSERQGGRTIKQTKCVICDANVEYYAGYNPPKTCTRSECRTELRRRNTTQRWAASKLLDKV